MTASAPSTSVRVRREAAEVVAREAAQILVDHVRGRFALEVAWKGAGDLVTAADKASEAHVVRRLAGLFPDDAIVAEEGGGVGGAAAWTWYVDPLDGTTNFVEGLPHFSVSLGATFGGRPAVGVVAAPELGKVYSAGLGLGATVDGPAGSRALAVSREVALDRVLAATGFPYDRSRRAAELAVRVRRALERCMDVRRLGSASLDLALVAEGTFGVYWEPRLKAWDIAAGAVLVAEAGGRVTDLAGGDAFLASGDIAASNGLLHEALLREVVGAEPA